MSLMFSFSVLTDSWSLLIKAVKSCARHLNYIIIEPIKASKKKGRDSHIDVILTFQLPDSCTDTKAESDMDFCTIEAHESLNIKMYFFSPDNVKPHRVQQRSRQAQTELISLWCSLIGKRTTPFISNVYTHPHKQLISMKPCPMCQLI